VKLAKNGVDILNAVRNDASLSFQERVPVATQEDIKTYGSAVLNFPGLANEFLDALVNRIGKVILSSRLYKNPFAMLKKGMLDYGETIEEVYTSLAKAKIYDPQTAETEFMKREIPDVKSIFHKLDYQNFFKNDDSEKRSGKSVPFRGWCLQSGKRYYFQPVLWYGI